MLYHECVIGVCELCTMGCRRSNTSDETEMPMHKLAPLVSCLSPLHRCLLLEIYKRTYIV
jgi:hypothetical protein